MTVFPEIKQLQSNGSAYQKLADREQRLRVEHADALGALSRCRTAPPPIDEIVRSMRDVVDQTAYDYAADYGHGILQAFGGERVERTDGTVTEYSPVLWLPPAPGGALRMTDLCALAPEAVKTSLERIIRSVSYEDGPPSSERAAAIEAAAARVATIEAEHTELVEAAANLTPAITLDLLPAVRARREQAAEQQRAEATRAAAIVAPLSAQERAWLDAELAKGTDVLTIAQQLRMNANGVEFYAGWKRRQAVSEGR